jgi:hypothetical protein
MIKDTKCLMWWHGSNPGGQEQVTVVWGAGPWLGSKYLHDTGNTRELVLMFIMA